MNPLALALAAAQAAPTVVAGIEYLHNEASSATKQQLALDALTVLTTGISVAAPNAAPIASELSSLFGSLIKIAVAGFNAAGTFKHSKAQPAVPAAK